VLFDTEVIMSENIDFQYDMKKNCTAEMSKFCRDVSHGRAKVIRCLEDNMEKPDFGPNCKSAVQKHIQHAAQDYRYE
jgi:golgi apparatus protein 1